MPSLGMTPIFSQRGNTTPSVICTHFWPGAHWILGATPALQALISLFDSFIHTLFPSRNGEQTDCANDIQDKYHNRVDAKVKELAFGAED